MAISAATAAWHDILERVNRWRLSARSAAARRRRRAARDWRQTAETVVNAAQGFEGPLGVRVEDKRQGPPKLHDLPSLQKLCGARFGWPASKTRAVAQALYEDQGK